MRVRGREQLRGHVLHPRHPEQVALLAGRVVRVLAAARVVGGEVEEVVERGERARERRRRRRTGCARPAAGRARAGGPRARTGGCRRAAAASPRAASGRTASLAGVERARRRAQVLGGRAEQLRVALDAASSCRSSGAARRAARRPRRRRSASSEANSCITAGRGVDQAGEVVAALGQLAVERVQRRDQVAQVLPPRGDRGVDAREVAVGRLEAAQHLAQVEPAALEPAAGVADQQLEVVARVGVELGEDLVGVDVRRGRGDRDRVAGVGRRRLRRCPARGR